MLDTIAQRRVLKAPISMTLAPGRIEWSFRLSVAAWPFCPSVERRYVCDNTGLYRRTDGCLRSRSWQRRGEIKRGEGRDGRLVGSTGLQKRNSFLYIVHSVDSMQRVPLWPEHFIVVSRYILKNAYIRSLQLFVAHPNAEMCLIPELVNMTQTVSPCCAMAARHFCLFFFTLLFFSPYWWVSYFWRKITAYMILEPGSIRLRSAQSCPHALLKPHEPYWHELSPLLFPIKHDWKDTFKLCVM